MAASLQFVLASFYQNVGEVNSGPRSSEMRPVDKMRADRTTKFELWINLKTAKDLGLTIPPLVLMRAEKVIK